MLNFFFLLLLACSSCGCVSSLKPLPDGDGLRLIVFNWINGGESRDIVRGLYGDITNWDVSLVTNMDQIFSGHNTFNADLSKWNVSSVVTMSSMFQLASSFNADISNWQIDQVTDISYMFWFASAFNGSLSSWQTDAVTGACDRFTAFFPFFLFSISNFSHPFLFFTFYFSHILLFTLIDRHARHVCLRFPFQQ